MPTPVHNWSAPAMVQGGEVGWVNEHIRWLLRNLHNRDTAQKVLIWEGVIQDMMHGKQLPTIGHLLSLSEDKVTSQIGEAILFHVDTDWVREQKKKARYDMDRWFWGVVLNDLLNGDSLFDQAYALTGDPVTAYQSYGQFILEHLRRQSRYGGSTRHA